MPMNQTLFAARAQARLIQLADISEQAGYICEIPEQWKALQDLPPELFVPLKDRLIETSFESPRQVVDYCRGQCPLIPVSPKDRLKKQLFTAWAALEETLDDDDEVTCSARIGPMLYYMTISFLMEGEETAEVAKKKKMQEAFQSLLSAAEGYNREHLNDIIKQRGNGLAPLARAAASGILEGAKRHAKQALRGVFLRK